MAAEDHLADNLANPFQEITEKDSKSLFKPKALVLVVSQAESGGPNILTAAWWMVAGYNPFRYLLAVGHDTYTYELIEENPEFVFAAPSQDMIEVVILAGMVSGKELDKIEHAGLELLPGKEVDVPLLKDAIGNMECTVADSYETNGYTYYFAQPEQAYVQKGMLNGRILSGDASPLGYLGSDWVNDDDATKHRFYVDYGQGDVRKYPGDTVLETLPPDLKEKYSK